ncbi:EAL domain-containing protein [Sphingobium sp. AN558]|uniref:putative bifunctional diguanylate cyclase/phosphodiesterase n=1 Tax=Sphingobium sp. AN558 TaxID=3133442 RepID=UPI0030C4CDC1
MRSLKDLIARRPARPAPIRPSLARMPWYVPLTHLWPILLLVGLSLGCLFALLFHLTTVQDSMERGRERQLVENAFRTAATMTLRDMRDYAIWDDAVVHLVRRFDSGWADDNLGPYLGKSQGYSYVVVVDGADRPTYVFAHGARSHAPFDVGKTLGPAFVRTLAEVDSIHPANASRVGFSRAGDKLYVFAVAAIIPLTDKVSLPPGRRHAVLVAAEVTPAFLAGLSRDNRTPALQVLKEGVRQSGESIGIGGSDDMPVARIGWTASRPGLALRDKIFPAFLLVGLCSLAVGYIILRRTRRGIDALRLSETRAQHLACRDMLTGLFNRRALLDHLHACLDADTPLRLLYMDLDGFKETNDVYGHGAGDELLREVTHRLNRACPRAVMVARVGGDEFAVLLQGIDDDAARQAQSILTQFEAPFIVGGYRVALGISIGMAASIAGDSAEELVRRADVAMFAAKAGGKNCARAYDPALDAGREMRKRMEQDLRLAIERREIAVVFQPIVDAGRQQIVCVEALARWSHPDHGAVPPQTFISIAEESGLIVALGRDVLVQACRQALDWTVDLAVNLSPAQFWDRGLGHTIRDVLAETGFPAHRLELEITEGYLLRRPDAAGEILDQLRATGVRVALDDFGTGFASIGYLQRLPFDRIKIDRSFIAQIDEEAGASELARAIVAIGDALRLPVTAEGVETARQAMVMRQAGCARLQGWLFGRPMDAAAMAAHLAVRGAFQSMRAATG